MFLGTLLLTIPTIYAQNYLAKAKEFLEQGDCERARLAYDDYKRHVNPQGDVEVQRRIDECGRSAQNPTQPKQDLTFTVNGVSFKMISVEGGTFTMGDNIGVDINSQPSHKVTVNSFYLGETEVTQALWKAVMGNTPSDYKGDDYPIVKISWEDCQLFCAQLNEYCKNQIPDGYHFVLPTEAEWEYAARGGSKSRNFKYAGSDNLYSVAWFEENSNKETHRVKTKYSNELGLYDMSGNVWEWCSDWYGPYFRISQINPTGSCTETLRTRRGGSCYGTSDCIPTIRSASAPDDKYSNLGVRLALKKEAVRIEANDGFQCGMIMKDMDNHSYKTVLIGNQCWMAQNLRTECDRDGKKLNKDDFFPPAGQTSNVAQYGYLYDWNTAMIVCPKGWHLPNSDEWERLVKGCGALGELSGGERGTWEESSGKPGYLAGFPGDYGYKYRNVTGFNALPAGSYILGPYINDDYTPEYEDFGQCAFFWSASECFFGKEDYDGSIAHAARFPHERESNNCTGLVNCLHLKRSYYSVRCIHD